jgi:hypothetical protein
MIRECFRVESGIIFDANMLKHEVGLDIDSISNAPFKAPDPLFHETRSLDKPGSGEIKGFFFRHIPLAILTWLSSPIPLVWRKAKRLRLPKDSEVVCASNLHGFQYEHEPREELADAISPIYDQLHLHWYWKLMEYIPWIIKKQSAEVADSDASWAYKPIWNRKKGRPVYHLVMHRGMKVHRSVKIRMLAQPSEGGKKYRPKIRCMIQGKLRHIRSEEWLADEPKHFKWVN